MSEMKSVSRIAHRRSESSWISDMTSQQEKKFASIVD